MSKQKKHMVTMAIAVAVLALIYTGVTMLSNSVKEEETDSISLIQIDPTELNKIDIATRKQESFSIQLKHDDSGTTYTMSGNSSLTYSQSLMQQLMNMCCDLSARPVEQDCKDLSKYGLSKEQEHDTIILTKSDNNTMTVTLGLIVDSLGTYCKLNDSNTVYLLDSDTAATLTQPQTYYRDLALFSGYYSLWEDLKTVSIDRMADGTKLTLQVRDISHLSEDQATAYSRFIFTEPLSCDADDSKLNAGLLGDLQNACTAQSIAEDFPSDVSKYGLDTPIRIHLTANNLDSTLLVGNKTGEDGIYVMPEGGKTVFICNASDFDFLHHDWNDWRSTNLLPCSLTQIDRIKVQQGDTVHTVTVTHVPADENKEADTETITATLNGNDMTDEAFQQLFLAVTSINYTRLLEDPQAADAEMTLTVTLTDKTTHKLCFAKGGSREYLVSVDDAPYCYGVSQDDVNSILDALKTK